ncbi:cytochrome P450 [Mycena polygramma]|nr:cytochrome P450 [Mycena polygramma]
MEPDAQTVITALVSIFVIFHLTWRALRTESLLDGIPSVGIPGGPFGFYRGIFHYAKHGRAITEAAFQQYPGKAFKVPLGNRWMVIISRNRRSIEDFKNAPDDSLSLLGSFNELFHMELTMGYEQIHDPYHVGVVRGTLTRNIDACFPIIRDEVVEAFNDLVPAKTDEWTSLPAMQTVLPIISRVSNRFFIGLKCRDPAYIKITTEFSVNVSKEALFLHTIPAFLRPVASRMFGYLESTTRAGLKHLGPMVQYRLDMDDQYGPDWPDGDRPNDLISWLLDEARGHPKRRTVRTLVQTILNVNFGAINTTTQAFLHALYNLAAHPECVEPLREEIEAVINSEGWNRKSLADMIKLDSFMKESARFVFGGIVAMMRRAEKEFTFSDGTTVPKGTLVAVPVCSEDDAAFDPFRFARRREVDGEELKHQMVIPDVDYLAFGLGRHACPGRFFAANEQKLMMAHLVLTYDIKLKSAVRPEDEWVGLLGNAHPTAEVMFRRRTV